MPLKRSLQGNQLRPCHHTLFPTVLSQRPTPCTCSSPELAPACLPQPCCSYLPFLHLQGCPHSLIGLGSLSARAVSPPSTWGPLSSGEVMSYLSKAPNLNWELHRVGWALHMVISPIRLLGFVSHLCWELRQQSRAETALPTSPQPETPQGFGQLFKVIWKNLGKRWRNSSCLGTRGDSGGGGVRAQAWEGAAVWQSWVWAEAAHRIL